MVLKKGTPNALRKFDHLIDEAEKACIEAEKQAELEAESDLESVVNSNTTRFTAPRLIDLEAEHSEREESIIIPSPKSDTIHENSFSERRGKHIERVDPPLRKILAFLAVQHEPYGQL